MGIEFGEILNFWTEYNASYIFYTAILLYLTSSIMGGHMAEWRLSFREMAEFGVAVAATGSFGSWLIIWMSLIIIKMGWGIPALILGVVFLSTAAVWWYKKW